MGWKTSSKALSFEVREGGKKGKGPKCPGIEVSKEYSEMWISGRSVALGGKKWGGNDGYIRI